MIFRTTTTRSSTPAPCSLQRLRRAARRAYGTTPTLLTGSLAGSELIAAVRHLGGSVSADLEIECWTLRDRSGSQSGPVPPDLRSGGTVAYDFDGMIRFTLDDRLFLALRTDYQVHPMTVERRLVLAARSLDEGLAVAERIRRAVLDFGRRDIVTFGVELGTVWDDTVAESDIILPGDFKQSVLGYTDSFWNSMELCRRMKMAPSRGILLIGAPGTGKTLVAPHLLQRYHQCRRALFINESKRNGSDGPFRALVEYLNRSADPAMVLIEDIDRMLDSQVVTAEFFLNVLDGMLRPNCPVLWVATSNDPSGMAENLLDRPGRLDRIFVFPDPGPEEAAQLLTRYSPEATAGEVIRELAHCSHGLAPSHLREICYAAALVAGEDGDYESALVQEHRRMLEQHRSARNYDQLLKRRVAGFREARS